MPEIENPWHSWPIDVHRRSDHPEVKALVDRIWDQYLPEEVVGKPGPKPKLSFRKRLRVLILDLYVAWLEDPALCIGVSMSVNHWKTNSRYNALHISKKIVPIIQALHEADLIDLTKGRYGGRGAQGNRTTRIRASITLRRWFREAKFAREDIGRAEGEELIILKDANNTQIEYEDTAKTNRMRAELEAYNALIAGSFIDIPSLQTPVINLAATMTRIENPWHSRPIDVHRWSDHPEVKALVDRIWDQYLPKEVVGRPGPKPKLSFRKQLRVLITAQSCRSTGATDAAVHAVEADIRALRGIWLS